MTAAGFLLDYARALDLAAEGPGSGCLVHHPDSTDETERSPLAVVLEDGLCQVTVAHFSDGDLVPGLSVTIDSGGRALRATDSFGTETDPEDAAREVARAVREVYARSTSTEVL
ncbi:MAG: hypothetical protein SangKO_099280 [Sandaracinaceae bacterium]